MCCLPLLCTAILTVSYKFYLMTDIWYRLRSRDESRNQVLLVQGARPLVPISRHSVRGCPICQVSVMLHNN